MLMGCCNAPTDYVAFYKLEDDSNDETGDYDGTDGGDVSYDGTSVSFGNVDDYVDLPEMLEMDVDRTLSIWFKTTGTTDFQCMCTTQANVYDYIMLKDGNKIQTCDDSEVLLTDVNEDYHNGEWWHVVKTKEDGTQHLYVNGELVLSGEESNADSSADGYSRIGNYCSSSTNEYHFEGSLANHRVYDKALTSTEIEDLYNEEKEKFE